MGWLPKKESAPFEHDGLEGVFFLDGDVIAEEIGRDWTRGQKFPRIAFPSGLKFDLWEGRESPIVHLFQLHGVVKQQIGFLRIGSMPC